MSTLTIPTGQISILDIKNVLQGTTVVPSNLSLRAYSELIQVDNNFNAFKGYSISVNVDPSTISGYKTFTPVVVDVSCVGISGNFLAGTNDAWITPIVNQANKTVTINCSENTGIATRYGTITVSHTNNSDCFEDISVEQYQINPVVIPSIPTDLQGTSNYPSSNTATFTWNSVSGATGYTVSHKYGDNLYSTIDVGNNTIWISTIQPSGTIVYVKVAAYNSAGTSAYCPEVNVTIGNPV